MGVRKTETKVTKQAATSAEGKEAKPNQPTAALYRTMKDNDSLLHNY